MKISEITTSVLAGYMKTDNDDALIELLLAASKAYVKSYTGLEDTALDDHEDLSIAVMILSSDMYDNRQMSSASNYTNQLVESILNLHKTV